MTAPTPRQIVDSWIESLQILASSTPNPTVEQHAKWRAIRGQMLDSLTDGQPPAGRAAVLLWAADDLGRMDYDTDSNDYGYDTYRDAWNGGVMDAAEKLRRVAAEERPAQPATVDLPTLAAALDGLHTLIATSSRDWQTYRVDAWLWAILCGWDCESAEHDDTCTHGALEETAAMHGWDADTVAKARRYRAAVRAITEAQPSSPVFAEIARERAAQDAKWGEQNHVDGTGYEGSDQHADFWRQRCENAFTDGAGTWGHVLLEEVFEAIAEADPARLRAELVQVATVAVAWVEAIDRRAEEAQR